MGLTPNTIYLCDDIEWIVSFFISSAIAMGLCLTGVGKWWRRLNFRLKQACEEDLTQLCADVCSTSSGHHACGGLALRCLQDHQDAITAEECQKEVFYFEKMEVDDYRNDVLLAEACRTDVETHCKNVEPGAHRSFSYVSRMRFSTVHCMPGTVPGGLYVPNMVLPSTCWASAAGDGAVLECLRSHREKLTEPCRKEELALNIIQARDVRLRPKLRKQCAQEIASYCSDVKPGEVLRPPTRSVFG